ncbi:MAG TPA: hypothetical protein VFQ44_10135 [Streptosporangiaceae bacterium]|nr:hypothetical protein [Streptosporangiaceae bacterium]
MLIRSSVAPLRIGSLRSLAAAVALIVLHLHHLRSVPAYLVSAARTDPDLIHRQPALASLWRGWSLRAAWRKWPYFAKTTPTVSAARLEAS